MNKYKVPHIIVLVISLVLITGFYSIKQTVLHFDYPEYFPKPNYDFKSKPITKAGFELGRKLFYDPIISRDSTISCASCHLQATGFTHVDHDLSHGIDGRIGKRNSLALMNLAWKENFMWDGGVNHIEVQALAPLTDSNEMDITLKEVVKRLNSDTIYQKQFYKAFNSPEVTGQKTLLALTQFVLSLNTFNSKYDKYIRKETKFTDQEKRGYKLFKKNCSSCHKEPLFTNNLFENNGLAIDTYLNDFGRMNITQQKSDSLKFTVPTLRNIEFTKPYMHDGRFETLHEVLNHYENGIVKSSTLSKALKKPIKFSHKEKVDILVFLKTLTDKEFLFDKRFSNSNY